MLILRHKQYPLLVVYKDPRGSWNKNMADIIKKDIEENNFDRFTEISVEQMAVYFPVKKKKDSEE